MVAINSLFVVFLKLAKKFLAQVSGTIILTMLFGSGLFIMLCSAKTLCMGTLSWFALEVILAFLGLVMGIYNFVKIK